MKDHPVPAEMAAAVIGSWRLGEGYRMTVSRSGAGGLHVHQEAVVRLKGRVVRDSPITYDPGERTLSFPGVGAIHRTIVTLRTVPGGLEYAFGTEISPGKWSRSAWDRAMRD